MKILLPDGMEQLAEDEPWPLLGCLFQQGAGPGNTPVPSTQSLLGLGIEQTPLHGYLTPMKYLKVGNKSLYRLGNFRERPKAKSSALPLSLWTLRA